MLKIKPIIAICSSASFYRQVVSLQAHLERSDYQVIIPAIAEQMKKEDNFDVSRIKTWLDDPSDYHKKTILIRGHFSEIEKSDVVLVSNYEKNGKPNYVGGNVLMEMTVAFYLNKPIFILNEVPAESAYYEELMGLQPIILHGNIDAFADEYDKLEKTLV